MYIVLHRDINDHVLSRDVLTPTLTVLIFDAEDLQVCLRPTRKPWNAGVNE